MEKISHKNYITLSILLIGMIVINTLAWNLPLLTFIAGIAYLAFFSFIIGSIIVPKSNDTFVFSPHGWSFIFGLLAMFAGIAIIGAGAIFTVGFNTPVFYLLLIAIPVACYSPYYKRIFGKPKFQTLWTLKQYIVNLRERKEARYDFGLILFYVLSASTGFVLLYAGQTLRSIQTPWQSVPSGFFLFYFLATAALVLYMLSANRTKLPLGLLIVHFLLSFSVALIVYQLGYGYDPFIHQATERIINATGTISPTPLYYLGQYGIVIFLHKLTLLDISLLDRALTPILASILIPTISFFVLSHWMKKHFALLLSLTLLTIPFETFIMSTPQNLANLFFLLTILLSLLYFRGKFSPVILWLLAIATIAIHPIAGIPLVVTVFLLMLFRWMYESYAHALPPFILTALVFSITLPVAFLLNGSLFTFELPTLSHSALHVITWQPQGELALDIAYSIYQNPYVLALLFIGLGMYVLRRQQLLRNNMGYVVAGGIVFINFLIIKFFITFPDLRDFDAGPFSGRLQLLTFYVLLPIFLIGCHAVIKRLAEHSRFSQYFLAFSIAGLASASLYMSYPRIDTYQSAKFFSLSSTDIKTVQYIEQRANPNHIVLANQMVGAAAIDQFGFKRYYDDQFYYSMPNGTPRTFYDAFLAMTYEGAKRETMLAVMDEAGVNEAYFVLNAYWRDAEKIKAAAMQTADDVKDIDNGLITVFTYRLE